MNIQNRRWQSIWLDDGECSVSVIDQTKLPYLFTTRSLKNCHEVVEAIQSMVVRGAPLIGVAGSFGLMLALQADPSDKALSNAFVALHAARPTAVNLFWALDRIRRLVTPLPFLDRAEAAKKEAILIANEDISMCEAIGNYGMKILQDLANAKTSKGQEEPLRVLTHCNAGWLATVDWGTALAPIYKAHRAGLNLHVWVDETRPLNQGASLTAYELACEGIPHTVIVDNAGGHLMQQGQVDAVIVGTDRTTKHGDVCNKIGTYLKALAAKDNGVPFFVALPSSTIDWSINDALSEIPIEVRSPIEVTHLKGLLKKTTNNLEEALIQVVPDGSPAFNPAFDITPARLVTALITDRGIVAANEAGLKTLTT